MAQLALALAVKNARLQALADQANAGADAETRATLTFYPEPQPATPDAALSGQTALGVVDCPFPLEASIQNAVLTMAAFDDAMAAEEGVTTWARLRNANGDTVADLTVGLVGEGANITITQTQIYPGVIIDITEGVIAEG